MPRKNEETAGMRIDVVNGIPVQFACGGKDCCLGIAPTPTGIAIINSNKTDVQTVGSKEEARNLFQAIKDGKYDHLVA